MKTLITNPPWLTPDRIGFRSNVRWPFTVSRKTWREKGCCSYHFPIYQAYTAALLMKHGMDVGVIDSSMDALDTEAYCGRIADASPDLVVIETATASFAQDIDNIRLVKERFGKPVALIGPHATIFHEAIMRAHSCVDYIARGEYEYTLLDLARALAERRPLASVAGLTWRNGGAVTVNPPRPYLEDLDSLPFPARDLYPWERYHEPTYMALPWITLISSRGCPFRCIYCLWPQTMYGHRYRTRSPGNVVDEIEECVKKYAPGEFFFDDDTFALSKPHVLGICGGIVGRGLDILWSCMGRVDTVDREMLEAMRRAGCRKIKFGVETGSKAIMEAIKKGIDLDLVEDRFRLAKECGLEVHGTFMIGLPGETRETIRETIDLARRLPNDSLQFSIATPFPGTEFYTLCEKHGFLVTDDWANFDGNFGAVMSYPDLSKDEMEEMLFFALQACQPQYGKEGKTLLGKLLHEARTAGVGAALAHGARYLLKRAGISRTSRGGTAFSGPLRAGLGWYPEEGAIGSEAFFTVERMGAPGCVAVSLTARAPAAAPPFPALEVSAGGKTLGTLALGAEWKTSVFTVQSPPFPLEVTIRADRAVRIPQPGKLPRFIGALVREIAVSFAGPK